MLIWRHKALQEHVLGLLHEAPFHTHTDTHTHTLSLVASPVVFPLAPFGAVQPTPGAHYPWSFQAAELPRHPSTVLTCPLPLLFCSPTALPQDFSGLQGLSTRNPLVELPKCGMMRTNI